MSVIIPDKETARKLNELSRHKMIERPYRDILMDLMICDIEGWDKKEYINQLKTVVNSIGKREGNA